MSQKISLTVGTAKLLKTLETNFIVAGLNYESLAVNELPNFSGACASGCMFMRSQ